MDNISTQSIFITQEEKKKYNNLSGKITYTDVLSTIPCDSINIPIKENSWKENKQTEYRWRILEFSKEKTVAEISLLKHNSDKRIYFNKKGEWVERNIPDIYDEYVKKEFYYYANKG